MYCEIIERVVICDKNDRKVRSTIEHKVVEICSDRHEAEKHIVLRNNNWDTMQEAVAYGRLIERTIGWSRGRPVRCEAYFDNGNNEVTSVRFSIKE